MFTQKREMKLV